MSDCLKCVVVIKMYIGMMICFPQMGWTLFSTYYYYDMKEMPKEHYYILKYYSECFIISVLLVYVIIIDLSCCLWVFTSKV